LDDYLQQDYRSGQIVLSREVATDRLLIVLHGRLYDPICRRTYARGSILQLINFFAANKYEDLIVAKLPSRVLVIPREEFRDHLTSQSSLTWLLARTISIERLAARVADGRS
jgi:CRP-like cAMP-binding protein